jgi:hypothetical protein
MPTDWRTNYINSGKGLHADSLESIERYMSTQLQVEEQNERKKDHKNGRSDRLNNGHSNKQVKGNNGQRKPGSNNPSRNNGQHNNTNNCQNGRYQSGGNNNRKLGPKAEDQCPIHVNHDHTWGECLLVKPLKKWK